MKNLPSCYNYSNRNLKYCNASADKSRVGEVTKAIIHIGSQKTGSTSIQTFLSNNPERLEAAGVSYVRTARGPAAHNKLVFKKDTEKFPRIMNRLIREITGDPSKTHVLSSEMLFSAGMARSFAQYFPEDLRRETKIIAYVRRQDKFLESMFKQVVKTGRYTGTPQDYATKKFNALRYSTVINAYAAAFGAENIILRPYEPKTFPEKNAVLDIAPHLGLHDLTLADLPAKFSNMSVSYEVSVLMGMVANNTDINIAELIRVIIASNPPGAFHSGDSYSLPECRDIVQSYAEDNARVCATYCPDRETLFDCSDLAETSETLIISDAEKLERMRQAQQIIFQAIGQSHQATVIPKEERAPLGQ